jgi:hypothetical protein
MKTKANGVPKAFEPYSKEEIQLVLSMVPTHTNVKNLAKSLGRTQGAIYTVYNLAYSGKWLKQFLKDLGPHQDNVATKVASTKKKLGIFIGHEPR